MSPRHPAVAHLVRALRRFSDRLGGPFAAAITYFSVLSLTPILMVAFAALGFTLTRFFPDVLELAKSAIVDAVAADPTLGAQLSALVDEAFTRWQVVGVVGLLSALWSGHVWVHNLRMGVRAQFRSALDDISAEPNPVVGIAQNIAVLFGLLLLLGVAGALSAVATAARGLIADLLALPDTALVAWLLSLLPLVANLVLGFALFAFLFRFLPVGRLDTRRLLQAAAMGAVGMAALQFSTGALFGTLAANPVTAAFGSVIVLMGFFNLFARLVVFVAAWVATADAPAFAPQLPVRAAPLDTPTDYATKLVRARLAEAGEAQLPAPDEPARAAGLGVGAAWGTALAGLVTLAAALRRRGR